ncbi:MAG TPA: carbamoyltransferase HypF [Actinomycetes bacterium]
MTVGDQLPVRRRVRVEGIVQGVGFRPFVHQLAVGLGLAGLVGNDGRGVFIEVEGTEPAVRAFLAALESDRPALAVVERVEASPLPVRGDAGFVIVASDPRQGRATLVAPDTATCDECLQEVLDPAERRYRYPFTNCTACGPRFTIVTGLPYDRAATTMAGFAMCEECAREYADPGDRRFHAQPVCCPRCGPALSLLDGSGGVVPGDDALAATAGLVRAGAVVAVKGLGGYHLCADATDEDAVAALRSRKHREEKPFALMVADVAAARLVAEVDPEAETLLTGRRRPIVLLPRRDPTGRVAASVAPGNRRLGVMLPYTPLHHLLLREIGRPVVLTSGNVSDEPIAYVDADAQERLSGIADAFLVHDRPIHVRTDDSVVRVVRGREVALRRSRGYAPEPLLLPWPFPRPVLGCGAELKSTFTLGKGRHAFVSHHIGDLENAETLQAFTTGIAHFRAMFDVTPEVVAHDLHPDYLASKWALDLDGVELLGVQHHHAHIASCLADNGEVGPVIGIALDGLGFGTDATLWGGELLVADLATSRRVGHLEQVPMPGGAAAIREPWRMAAAYLQAAYGGEAPAGPWTSRWDPARTRTVRAMADRGVNAPLTSSAGRLFDAVAALAGVRDSVTYEGQAAVELEQLAEPDEDGSYPAGASGSGVVDDPLVLRGTDLVRSVVDDLSRTVPVGRVAARFHNGLADALVAAASTLRRRHGLDVVALSGGVFQNALLLDRLVTLLELRGFRVLTHSRVPPNDGGISLGQAAVAAARDRADH